jgi:hypothetical protein
MDQTFASWNQLIGWLRQIEALRSAAYAGNLPRPSVVTPVF